MHSKFKKYAKRLSVKELQFDYAYQRPLSKARARRMGSELREIGLGVIHVSLRPNGRYFVIDGQHRVEACRAAGMTNKEVQCLVYEGLTVADEAALFRLLNRTHCTGALDDFHAGICGGDEECVDIALICSKYGFSISGAAGDGIISCVNELRSIYRRKGGPKLLAETLAVIRSAWGNIDSAAEKSVIGGVARFLDAWGAEVDTASLIQRLAKMASGPLFIIRNARLLYEIRSASMSSHAAEVIRCAYNKGRRHGAVGEKEAT